MSNSVKVSVHASTTIDQPNAHTVFIERGQLEESFVAWTNEKGNGLWLDGKQVVGTDQFSAGKNAREAIRRYFQKLYRED